ncbi:hypothetical protein SH139x_000557 [Planctomycetaceae bacterium SH139]
MLIRRSLIVSLAVIFPVVAFAPNVFMQDAVGQEEERDLRDEIWWEAAKLLQRREYAIAANFLESELDSLENASYASGIQADLDAVRNVLALSDSVEYKTGRLQPGNSVIELVGIPHKLKKIDKAATQTVLVFENAQGEEVRRTLAELDGTAWMKLGESGTSDWQGRNLTFAVFWSYDRYRNVKLAREYLNAAAKDGANVQVWLTRLDQLSTNSRPNERNRKTTSQRFIGKWSVALNNGVRLTFDIRGRSKATLYFKGKPLNAKWTEDGNGVIRMTDARGKTFIINVAEDRFFGTTNNGVRFRGVRQAGG